VLSCRINHRMHNKLLLVDGSQAVIGGRNIGDRYFGLGMPPHFIDLDLVCRGPSVSRPSRGSRCSGTVAGATRSVAC
jgi:putative cardiolipin synthase